VRVTEKYVGSHRKKRGCRKQPLRSGNIKHAQERRGTKKTPVRRVCGTGPTRACVSHRTSPFGYTTLFGSIGCHSIRNSKFHSDTTRFLSQWSLYIICKGRHVNAVTRDKT
ncbi:unnamed protein product, partial [Ectocarpus sp. 6 AP-2014]